MAVLVFGSAIAGFTVTQQDPSAKERTAQEAAQEVLNRWAAFQVQELTTKITDDQLSAAGIDPAAIGVRGHAASARDTRASYEPGSFQIEYDITKVGLSADGVVHVDARQRRHGRQTGEDRDRQDVYAKRIALVPSDPGLRLVLEAPDIRHGL